MYAYNTTTCTNNTSNDLAYNISSDFFGHPLPVLENDVVPVPLPALQVDCLMIGDNALKLDYSATEMMKQEVCNYATSSGCSSYASSPPLHGNNMYGFQYQQLTHFSSYDDFAPVRKAFSTGDLERNHRAESPLSNESSIIECMNAKACKCSPEEKKEKIEKYRSKRNLRNFNKKIKYVCRKTLADSRPRIRGRFAKNNDDNDKGVHLMDEWNHIAADNEDDNENWISFVDAFSASVIP